MTDFNYKKYSLEQLDNWLHDAVNCEDISPQELYDTIVKVVSEDVDYHEKFYRKSLELLNLLGGYNHIDASGDEHHEGWDYTATGEKFPSTSNKDWEEFWKSSEESSEEKWAHPESSLYKHINYTEEELDAMCDAAENKEKCREYNMREAEYYNKRAELDAAYEAIKEAGGYEWTP